MPARLTVVISQSQSHNPARRELEEGIVTRLIMENGVDVIVIPHLYDLTPDSTGLLALQGVSGPLVVCAWLFPRAAHWILDRQRIAGHLGTTLLVPADDSEDDDEEEVDADQPQLEKPRVAELRERPDRRIYCLDLRVSQSPAEYVDEIRRIRQENSVQLVGLAGIHTTATVQGSAASTPSAVNGHAHAPTREQLARFQSPTNDTALSAEHPAGDPANWLRTPLPPGQKPEPKSPSADGPTVQRVESTAERRWYPVIDYSRCTNCMECIDFCLFGVYGVDKLETILVEQPDNCRKGCPACSRVCPENAIMFPQHKTPAIAGSPEVGASLKIDLSELFGAPAENKSAADVAVAERDEQLRLAGRHAVGDSVGIKRESAQNPAPVDTGSPKSAPSAGAAPANLPPDKLDRLIDQLDALDL